MEEVDHQNYDIKSLLLSRRRSTCIFGPPDVCYIKTTTRKNILSEQTKIFTCNITGKEIFPQSLCVLANRMVDKANVGPGTKIKSQCVFLLRNIYTEEEVKIMISIPGTLEIVIVDSKNLEKPLSQKNTFNELSVSSNLRYMFSFIEPVKSYYSDPFEKGYQPFKQFLTHLIEFELKYKPKNHLGIGYQQMTRLLGNSLHLTALFINRMKLHPLLERYYLEFKQQMDAHPITVQFFCEAFAFNRSHQILKQILISRKDELNPMWIYYLSLGTSKDQQVEVLKLLSYMNKAEIWLLLADSYINYHITNLTMVSKGLQILDILAQKRDSSIKLINPYSSKPNMSLVKPISVAIISMLPTIPTCHFIKFKPKIESYGVEDDISKLCQLIKRYYDLSLLQKAIVKKLAFLISEIGEQKTQHLFPKVFEQEFYNEDSLYYSVKMSNPRKQTLIPQEQFEIPSFAKSEGINPSHYRNVLSTNTIANSEESTKPQLWSIMEQNATYRDQEVTASRLIKFDPVQYCKKKYSSKNFIHLLEITLDIHQALTSILQKLEIKSSQSNSLNHLKLSVEGLLILAEAAEIYEKIRISIALYKLIQSRVFDLYTYYKLIKLSSRCSQFSIQLVSMNQLMLECSKHFNFSIQQFPPWVEEQFFCTLKKKGVIFVEALMKSNNITYPTFSKCIGKYTNLMNKESMKE